MANTVANTMASYFITGVAGFIGFHVAKRLLSEGHRVVGFDNLNDYYDPALKETRLELLRPENGFTFVRADLCDHKILDEQFETRAYETVIHLAAQAGVRYSLENPRAYIDSNVVGFLNILECYRRHQSKHFVYASSSSVYGLNEKQPFSEDDAVDHPASLYAATKKSNELMAHTYSHLFGLPTTGLRFFTVYGPWGRPDMAIFKFVKNILAGRPIDVYNHGNMRRDFTYIDDIVTGIVRVAKIIPVPDNGDAMTSPATAKAPYRVYNIGNNQPIELMALIAAIEKAVGKKAVLNFLPMQPGDVLETYADIDRLNQATGFVPDTPLEEGIARFVEWFTDPRINFGLRFSTP